MNVLIILSYLVILAVVSWQDWHTQTISDCFSILILLLGLAALCLFPEHGLTDRLIGLVIIALPMLFLTLHFQRGFGGGDIKLMAASGFLLGWKAMLPAIFLGLLSAALYCVWMLLTGKLNRASVFPLGPFLALGLMIGVLFGDTLFRWYLR